MPTMERTEGTNRQSRPFLMVALAAAMLVSAFVIPAVSAQSSSTDTVTVNSVSFTGDNRKWYGYGPGDEIIVSVRFSGNATVTGSPQLSLTIGDETKTAAMKNSWSTGMSFGYEVESGDGDTDGIAIPENAISLNGGTIQDSDGNDVDLTHDAVTSTHRVGAVPVQNDNSPVIESIDFTSSPGADDVYSNEYLEITVTFDKEIDAVHGVWMYVQVGDDRVQAHQYEISETDVIFRAWMDESLADLDGVSIEEDSLETVSGAIVDADLNPAYLEHDAVADDSDHKVGLIPEIQSISFSSVPTNGYYGTSARIEAAVNFTVGNLQSDHNVLPQLILELDSGRVWADFASRVGSKVYFSYVTQSRDYDDDGIAIPENAFSGRMYTNAGLAADVTHDAFPADSNHKVDAIAPEFESAEVAADGETVSVTFSEDIQIPSLLDWLSTQFDVPVGHFFSAVLDVVVDGNEHTEETDANLSGDTITLTMATPITESQEVEISYNNSFATDAARLFRDRASNPLPLFSDKSVTNSSTEDDVTSDGNKIVVDQTDLKFTEGGSGSVSISLSSVPSDDVTVSVGVYPTSSLTFDSTTLTFTTTNYDTDQTLTISTDTDTNNVNGWHRVSLSATGGGYDSAFSGFRVLTTEPE